MDVCSLILKSQNKTLIFNFPFYDKIYLLKLNEVLIRKFDEK